LITNVNGTSIKAKKVVLAVGYHDVYPDIPGFVECWADTIISCPFCDGYENRDCIWGIVVNSKVELERLPKMAQNWTSKIKVFTSPNIEIEPSYQNELSKLDIPLYKGIITNVNHTNTKVQSVSLESGEKIEVEMLLWIPSKRPSPLIQRLVENLDLELDEQGNVKTDQMQKTNVKGLYAAGDVKGSMGALAAASDGGIAGVSIVHEWYD
jgi:thioredoxin reductase